MKLLRNILWVDSLAGLFVGLMGLALLDWLSDLFALPRGLVLITVLANLAYGAYSGSLALRAQRPRRLILLLIAANAAWAVICCLAVIVLARQASWYGLAYIGAEGLFVAVLAWLEWQQREALITSDPAGSRLDG